MDQAAVDIPSERPPPPAGDSSYYPVRLTSFGTRRRSRLTVLVRLALAFPHYYWLALWSAGAIVVALISWWATLFMGRSPRRLHGFLARYMRYQTHVTAYLSLLGNPYPHFVGDPGDYPVDLEVDEPARQSRWKTAFRIILAIPAFVLATIFSYLLQLISFAGWVVCIVVGRMPDGMQNLGLFCLRYQQQTYAYMMLLTDRYPPLASPPPTTGEWRKPVPGWQREAIEAGWTPPAPAPSPPISAETPGALPTPPDAPASPGRLDPPPPPEPRRDPPA